MNMKNQSFILKEQYVMWKDDGLVLSYNHSICMDCPNTSENVNDHTHISILGYTTFWP